MDTTEDSKTTRGQCCISFEDDYGDRRHEIGENAIAACGAASRKILILDTNSRSDRALPTSEHLRETPVYLFRNSYPRTCYHHPSNNAKIPFPRSVSIISMQQVLKLIRVFPLHVSSTTSFHCQYGTMARGTISILPVLRGQSMTDSIC